MVDSFRRGPRQPKRGPAASVAAARDPATADARRTGTDGARHGLARTLSRLGVCSRSVATAWVAAGRVAIDGRVVRDPGHPVPPAAVLALDGAPLAPPPPIYVALNKPRGLVTTAADERGRDTVYRCFEGADLPWLGPVGRLDRASEGLLLFTNDPGWAARLTDPEQGVPKTYHVQVDRVPDAALVERLLAGVVDGRERLAAVRVTVLRAGTRHGWLEVTLDEGRNRQIRRMLAALGIGVLRLVRTAIGTLALGPLGKGAWRVLGADEVRALAPPSARPMAGRSGLG